MDKTFKDDYDMEFAKDDSLPDEELTEDQLRLRNTHALATTLAGERAKAINDKRESVDTRLVDAARSYKGATDDAGRDSLAAQFSTPDVASRVYHNITRQVTNDGASQLGDLLFPSDDKNYGLNPAPLAAPPLALAAEPAVDGDGEPLLDGEGTALTNQQAHTRRVERTRQKGKRMFTKVDAALIDATYPQKGRRCILDAAMYGTGILKGPIPNKKSERWAKRTDGKYSLKTSGELAPGVKVVSPFDFYPDMSATEPDEWGYTWERAFLSPFQLQKAAKQKGFAEREVTRLLTVGPLSVGSMADEARESAREESYGKNLSTGRFELWERHGPLERKSLAAYGVEAPGTDMWLDCVVYMINDRVLQVSITPYERAATVYSVFNWDEDPLSVFGYGIPYLMSDPQHVYNTAWRMTLDNAGVSTMPQVVIDKLQIKPADGGNDYSLKSGKVWERVGEVYSAERRDKPFELFHITQDIQQLFGIMDRSLQDAYELTGVTRVDKTQQMNDNAPVTLGATQIQQNNSSVSRRSQARRYDDQITATLIQRFYDYFMQFEDDDDIKAVLVVEPRGSTILLSKELQATNLMTFYQMTSGGQAEGVKELPLLRAISSSMQHPEGQFISTDDEMAKVAEDAANNPPPPDPAIELENRKLEVSEAEVELAQGRLQLDAQVKEADYQLRVAESERKFELEYAKLDATERAAMDKSQSEFSKIELKANFDAQIKAEIERNKRDMKAADLSTKQANDQQTSTKTAAELGLRQQSEDRQDAELHHKITTGQPGI